MVEGTNVADTIYKLKHVYTISDVFDILESLDAINAIEDERNKIRKEQNATNS